MKVKDLIKQLSELVDSNPKNADLKVRWYDDIDGQLAHGDGWPIRLFTNIYSKEIFCVINAIDEVPAFGFKQISNRKIRDENGN